MEENIVKNYSLGSLAEMYFEPVEGDIIYKGCILVHRHSDWLRKLEIFRYPCRINAFIAILCVKGNLEIILNMKRYSISEDCIFLNQPDNIIQIEKWEPCEIFVAVISDDIAKTMNIDYKKALTLSVGMHYNPVISLSKNEVDNLLQTFHTMSRDISLFKGAEYGDEIINTSLMLSTYKFFSILHRHHELLHVKSDSITNRANDHYTRFMQMLEKNFRQEHNIGFYASGMYITPKYLSSVIKKMSGKSAVEWINGYVVMEAQYLLKFSRLTIQEISDYLHFPNQSFFTQYFRRLTGITPGSYRKKQ